MGNYIDLLQRALTKQNELHLLNGWKDELPRRAPPVLWFGKNTDNVKIVTIGANPSRSEFLDGNNTSLKNLPIDRVPYLKPSKERFYTFDKNELTSELKSETLYEVIDSYNNYWLCSNIDIFHLLFEYNFRLDELR